MAMANSVFPSLFPSTPCDDPLDWTSAYISPAASELKNSRPSASTASPTGRRQESDGHKLSFVFLMTWTRAEVLSDAALGWPVEALNLTWPTR